jgi:hypothetical protein
MVLPVKCIEPAFELFMVPDHISHPEAQRQFLLNNLPKLVERLCISNSDYSEEAIQVLGELYLITYGQLPKPSKKAGHAEEHTSRPYSRKEFEAYRKAIHGVKKLFIEWFQAQVEDHGRSLHTIKAASKAFAFYMTKLADLEPQLTIIGTEG